MTQLNIFEKKKTVKNEILYNLSTSQNFNGLIKINL